MTGECVVCGRPRAAHELGYGRLRSWHSFFATWDDVRLAGHRAELRNTDDGSRAADGARVTACRACGVALTGRQRGTRFCSDACRQAEYRVRVRVERSREVVPLPKLAHHRRFCPALGRPLSRWQELSNRGRMTRLNMK